MTNTVPRCNKCKCALSPEDSSCGSCGTAVEKKTLSTNAGRQDGDTVSMVKEKDSERLEAPKKDKVSLSSQPSREDAVEGVVPNQKLAEINQPATVSHCLDLEVSYNASRIFVEGVTLSFDFRILPKIDGITDLCVELDAKGLPRMKETLEEYLCKGDEYEAYISFTPPKYSRGKLPFSIYIGYKKEEQDYWFVAKAKHKIFRAKEKAQKVLETLKIDQIAHIDKGQASDGIIQSLKGLEALKPKEDDPASDLQNVDLPPDWKLLSLKKCRVQHEIGKEAPSIKLLQAPPPASLTWHTTLKSSDDSLLHVISRPTVQLGKNRSCEVVTRVMDTDGSAQKDPNSKISRFHCHIENRGSDCCLVDVGYDQSKQSRKPSAYGTFLNGTRISSGQSTVLPSNIEFKISLAGPGLSDMQAFVFTGCIWTCRALGRCRSRMHDNCKPEEPACMMLRRHDGVPETFIVLWKFCPLNLLEDKLRSDFGDMCMFRHKGAFAYMMQNDLNNCGWLVPGQMIDGVKVGEYRQFGKWAEKISNNGPNPFPGN